MDCTAEEKSECEVNEPYYFESDHVALKGNADYHRLLSTIALLEAQRTQAVKDIDVLLERKQEALEDPIAFVQKLQNKEDLGLPTRQNIAELPKINWERYANRTLDSNPGPPRHATRHQKQQQSQSEQSSAKSSRSNTPTPSTSQEDASTPFTSDPPTQASSSAGLNFLVRGKRKEGGKPSTFNKLWTIEEQQRLEELLVQYPPEEVEARRWQKIANALGNRTRQQVQSRVQKYFIRLAKEGMPIPGRTPYNLHGTGKRKHGNTRSILQFPTSTFCASYKPPVYMSDDEDSSSRYTPDQSFSNPPHQQVYVSDEEDIPEELRDSEEYLEILRLKRQKKCGMLGHGAQAQRHDGYQCDRCGEDPIAGTRYHCLDCPSNTSTDFCHRCSQYDFETEDHKTWHSLSTVSLDTSSSHLDQDYDHSQFGLQAGDYNYLDPNYMPANG